MWNIGTLHGWNLEQNYAGPAFLTLLNCRRTVSVELNEIKICSLSLVHPSSVSQLSLNLFHGFLSNFGCWLHWTIRSNLQIFKMLPLLISNRFQIISNWSRIFFPIDLTKVLLCLLKFWLIWNPIRANFSKATAPSLKSL